MFGEIFAGRDTSERIVRAVVVVSFEPLSRLRSHLIQTFKDVHIEHGLAVRAVKAFDKAVLHGPAGLDEFEFDAVLFGPVGDRNGGEFRPRYRILIGGAIPAMSRFGQAP